MRVLRIIARLNVGGPARHVVWLADGLRDRGYETLLVTGVVPPGEDDMTYFAEAAGVRACVIPQMSREISAQDAFAAWKVFRLMLRDQPVLVHTHTAKAGTVGRVAGFMYRWLTPSVLLGKPRRCRFVHTYHGHVFHSYYGPAKTRLILTIERLLARLVTDRIVVLSEQQRQEINEKFGVGKAEQFAVIPLGLDLSVFRDWLGKRQRLRAELNAPDDELLVGIVGRLTEVKNHELFLKAAARLKEISGGSEGRRVRFLVIGSGAQGNRLQEQTNRLGLNDQVVYLGTREDAEFFYPALDVVALTSYNEGTPLTLIEAMANERAVIATAVGGVVDLLGPPTTREEGFAICERGISVASEDVEGFARGLHRLVGDEALRAELGRRGREFVDQNYAKERLIEDIARLYKEVLTPND